MMQINQRNPQVQSRELVGSIGISDNALRPVNGRNELVGVSRVIKDGLFLGYSIAKWVDIVDIGVLEVVHGVVGRRKLVVLGLVVRVLVDVGVFIGHCRESWGVERGHR